MATTTNYSWTTPDDTALVKDGASAIRTLGSSADTTVKALNPGTTSGDLDYYTSSTAKARIAIGTNGQVLTSNGTVPSWATPSSGGMTLISTTTLTGASITLSSIPATYKDLYIIIRNLLPASDGASFRMRFNSDTNANRHSLIGYDTAGGDYTFNATNVQISSTSDNAVTQSIHYLYIPDYTNTTTWKIANFYSLVTNYLTTTSFTYKAGFAAYNQTSAISSLDFLASTGNLTSGSVLLYGVK